MPGAKRWIAALTLAALALPGAARAEVQAILIPGDSAGTPGPGAAEALEARAASLPGVGSARLVFDRGERAYLERAGRAKVSRALRLSLRDDDDFARLSRWLAMPSRRQLEAWPSARPLEGSLERNARATPQGFVPHPEQWGMLNRGAPQDVEVTDIQVRAIPGVPGEDAGLASAPAEAEGSPRVRVAVIDSGVELAHPSLQGAIHRTESECKAVEAYKECIRVTVEKDECHEKFANLDTDGNGYPLDCNGWNVLGQLAAGAQATGIRGGNEMTDEIGHGTHVSGIIAGRGFVQGVSARAEILPVKVMGRDAVSLALDEASSGADPDPRSPDFTRDGTFADSVARGVLYAIRSGAQVLNLSLGYPIHDDSEVMRAMVELAQSKGVLVVAAAGNQSSRMPVYPCRYEGVLCVASHSADGSISHFSDYGDSVDLAAPGHRILSAWPMGLYPSFFTERKGHDFKSGTSMAAPFVAGMAARLLGAGIPAAEVYPRLVTGARPHRAPTVMAELQPKFTLSGNADLARAFAAGRQPLVLPADKEPLLVVLDRQRGSAVRGGSFSLRLRNRWAAAGNVRVELSLDPASAAARAGLRLGDGSLAQTFDLGGLDAGELRKIEGSLSWRDVARPLELPGSLHLEARVTASGAAERRFRKSVEFVVPVRPPERPQGGPQGGPQGDAWAADPAFSRAMSDLAAKDVPADHAIKPISCIPTMPGDPGASEDLLVMGRASKAMSLQVLAMRRENGSPFLRKQGRLMLSTDRDALFTFSCLDHDRDGRRDYVVVTLNEKDKKVNFGFHDSAFKRVANREFGTATTTLPKDFRWLSAGASRGLAPAWLASGLLPPSEAPPYDPWATKRDNAATAVEPRLYVLGEKGLSTVAPPQGLRYGGLLRPTRQELREGSATVLLYRGKEHVLEFFVAELRDLAFGTPRALSFDAYHQIARLKPSPVWSAAGAAPGELIASAYVDEGAGGRMRVSLKAAGDRVRALRVAPLKAGDIVSEVIALFSDASGRADSLRGFYRSRFELYYFDESRAGVASTDLRQYAQGTHLLPAVVGGEPALVLPEGEGGGMTTELLLPRGGVIERPAAFKTLGVGGCELIQLLPTGLEGAGGAAHPLVERLTYRCGDQFVFVRL